MGQAWGDEGEHTLGSNKEIIRLYGFDIAAAFDAEPPKIGRKIKNVTAEDASNVHTLKKRKIYFADGDSTGVVISKFRYGWSRNPAGRTPVRE